MLIHSQVQNQINKLVGSGTNVIGINGEEGAGKGYIAEYIASKITGISIEKLSADPFVRKIDAAKITNGIDTVREIQGFLKLRVPGVNSIKRAVIIEHIDGLKHEAQNALLKTLEEPPFDTVIVVTFAKTSYVLPTIHSRINTINLPPVNLDDSLVYFKGKYTSEEITRAYYMSGGQSGLMVALLDKDSEHPLVEAIGEARTLISQTRYERLSQVDKIVKNKDLSVHQLLDGLYRLVHAGYSQLVRTKSADQLRPTVQRLKMIEGAISDLQNNVQGKLVLSRLFMEL